jgi:hypothetical protein
VLPHGAPATADPIITLDSSYSPVEPARADSAADCLVRLPSRRRLYRRPPPYRGQGRRPRHGPVVRFAKHDLGWATVRLRDPAAANRVQTGAQRRSISSVRTPCVFRGWSQAERPPPALRSSRMMVTFSARARSRAASRFVVSSAQ